jgi:hypothetical protein
VGPEHDNNSLVQNTKPDSSNISPSSEHSAQGAANITTTALATAPTISQDTASPSFNFSNDQLFALHDFESSIWSFATEPEQKLASSAHSFGSPFLATQVDEIQPNPSFTGSSCSPISTVQSPAQAVPNDDTHRPQLLAFTTIPKEAMKSRVQRQANEHLIGQYSPSFSIPEGNLCDKCGVNFIDLV